MIVRNFKIEVTYYCSFDETKVRGSTSVLLDSYRLFTRVFKSKKRTLKKAKQLFFRILKTFKFSCKTAPLLNICRALLYASSK